MSFLPFEHSLDDWGDWYLSPDLKLKYRGDHAISVDIAGFNCTADILEALFIASVVSFKVQNPLSASNFACLMFAIKTILKFNGVDIKHNTQFDGYRCAKNYYIRVVNKRKVPNALRVSVFERDKFKCVYCGLSAKDGAVLNVDHILPVSKGGSNESYNLQTLCRDCNNGKADRIMPDDAPSPSVHPA